jgi:hypothetical protein
VGDAVLSEVDELLGRAAGARVEQSLPAAPEATTPDGPAAPDPVARLQEHGVDPLLAATLIEVSRAIAVALPAALAGARAEAAAPPTAATVTAHYARYLGLFVGAGLMAGAVVHFPLAPLRYAIMGLVGALAFAAGSIGEGAAGRAGTGRAVSLGASLVLALAIGMVAGGIQHFEDVPGRATVLVPAGLLLGLGAFVVRDGHRLPPRATAVLAAGAAAVALSVALALGALAPAGGAVGGHAHGAAGAAGAAASHGHP